ncbi:MAG: cytochrome c oxidase subunit II [Bacteroidetes bacterium]|nr:cytochrome c oxidase subunit II [Bacteroidota bacterium]MBK8143539.1 cytochrome c oxidase subunit II [Bacteroidota bacterium]MBP6314034.1 cytochrome c oxidase subunit II [Chitinophagaceae bacterium]
MSGLLLVLLVALIFVVLYQVARSSEMVARIQGEEIFDKRRNKILAYSMLVLMVAFFVGIYACHQYMMPLMAPIAASDHGKNYDFMFFVTLVVTGIIFVLTQILLFWFAFKYQRTGDKVPFHFAHSTKLELVWTTIPAIAMAVLVAIGLKAWFTMTSDAPKGAMQIEIIGKQFNWISRYPGPDGVLGKRYFTNINDQDNILGLDWKDQKNMDDIIVPNGEIRLVKDKPVELIIGSRDVIHDVGLTHFRMKMDAVPGITSRLWFTPTITTREMKEITGNENFVYEISCDQMCGVGHYSMRAVIIVETQAEHDAWLAKQQSYYAQNHAPATPAAEAPKVDSSKNITMNIK